MLIQSQMLKLHLTTATPVGIAVMLYLLSVQA